MLFLLRFLFTMGIVMVGVGCAGPPRDGLYLDFSPLALDGDRVEVRVELRNAHTSRSYMVGRGVLWSWSTSTDGGTPLIEVRMVPDDPDLLQYQLLTPGSILPHYSRIVISDLPLPRGSSKLFVEALILEWRDSAGPVSRTLSATITRDELEGIVRKRAQQMKRGSDR